MSSTSSQTTHSLLTRREALRRGTVFLGSAVLGGALLPRVVAQTTPAAASFPSVENPEHPLAKMRVEISQTPINAQKVTDRHYLLSGPGGNVGLYVGQEAVVAIDSGSGKAPSTERLREQIRTVSDRPLRYLVNTHWHFDHTDGNANLRAAGATIVAHRNVRTRLSSPNAIAFFNALFPARGRDALPTLTFDHEMEIDVGDEPIHLVHLPNAHTDGDTIIHWRSLNVIQTGDIVFSGAYPFIDGPSGGSLAGMIRATDEILKLANDQTKIIPGHGPLLTKKGLENVRTMLTTVRERLGKLKAAGKSVDEAVAAKPLADLDETWGKGLFNTDTFVRLVYSLPS